VAFATKGQAGIQGILKFTRTKKRKISRGENQKCAKPLRDITGCKGGREKKHIREKVHQKGIGGIRGMGVGTSNG